MSTKSRRAAAAMKATPCNDSDDHITRAAMTPRSSDDLEPTTYGHLLDDIKERIRHARVAAARR